MIRLSICIPTYNRVDLLVQTLLSVVWQSVVPYEVIIVDNASTEDMTEVINMCQQHKYTFVRNENNLGFVKNWNRCIDLATGDYLCILHSDDLLHRDWYETFSAAIQDNPGIDVFSCALALINDRNYVTDIYFPLGKTGMLKDNFIEIWKSCYFGLTVSGGMVVKKSVFRRVGYFEERFGTECDLKFYLRVIKACKIFYINEVLFGYKIHSYQTMDMKFERKTVEKKINSAVASLVIFKEFLDEEIDNSDLRRFLYQRRVLVFFLMGIVRLLRFDRLSFRKLWNQIRTSFPDLFAKKGDFIMLIKLSLHFTARVIKGKFLRRNYKYTFDVNSSARYYGFFN